jgi:alkylation response protein AidB-like acyl-CoA dehydrogenase
VRQDGSAEAFDDADLAALGEAVGQVLASEADRLALHRHIDGKVRLDRVLWAKAVELGWPAIGLPEDAGGLGFGPRGLDLLHRQLGRFVAPGPFLATLSAAQAISDAADAEVRSQWLPRLAAGECKLAVAASLDAAPDSWIMGDEDCEAALVPLAGGDWGLVPLPGGGAATMWDRTRTMFKADLSRSAPIATLPGGPARQSLARHLSLGIASDSIGGARAITEQTIAYMKERVQFGRPIASFQALKHRIADLMTLIVSGEEFVALAVDAAANGSPDADIWAKLAKARCTETYAHVAGDCLQLHGGVGFTWEFDVHLYLNRARLSELLVGANPAMKDDAALGLADAIRAGRQPLEMA